MYDYDKVTITDVRNSFTYSRQLMRDFIELTKTATEFDNNSEIGQLVNELVASASIAQSFLDYKLSKGNK
jgi:hypothetical protein